MSSDKRTLPAAPSGLQRTVVPASQLARPPAADPQPRSPLRYGENQEFETDALRALLNSRVRQKKIHPQMRKGRKEDPKRVIKVRGGLAFDRD